MLETIRTAFTPARNRILAVLAVVVIVLLAPLPHASREMHALYDLGHAPLFGLASALVYWWLRAYLPKNNLLAAMIVWTGSAIVGLGSEYAQGFIGRHTSWSDAISNMLGSAAFLIWAMSDPAKSVILKYAGVLIGIALLFVCWRRPALDMADALRQHQEMPLLASFERPQEFSRWTWSPRLCRVRSAREWASQGKRSMGLQFQPAKYSSITMYWPVPDWSAYEALTFDILLKGAEPLPLTVKIEDVKHNGDVKDRYNGTFELQPGIHSYRIRLWDIATAPEGRTLNLRRIKRVQFFTHDLQEPRELLIDNIRLRP